MNEQRPRVSIGLPVYNGENYLAEAIESLLGQTFEDFELIISDNASTDRTPAICREYTAKDRRIRYERQADNRGAAWNFNRVFELARGEYYKWAAHDDLHYETFLERCVDVLSRCPDVAWCHPRSTHIGADGRPLPDPRTWDVRYTEETPSRSGADARASHGFPTWFPTREARHAHERLRAILLGTGGCVDVYGLMRTETVRKTMGHLPYYGADKVFVAEMSLWGRFREIPETLFCVRVHPDASGSLRSAVEQQRFENPKASPWFTFTRLQLLRGYVQAILRAELSVTERARCFRVLFAYLLQIGKWRHVAARTLKGMGTGGGYLDHLDHGNQYEASNQSCLSSTSRVNHTLGQGVVLDRPVQKATF